MWFAPCPAGTAAALLAVGYQNRRIWTARHHGSNQMLPIIQGFHGAVFSYDAARFGAFFCRTAWHRTILNKKRKEHRTAPHRRILEQKTHRTVGF